MFKLLYITSKKIDVNGKVNQAQFDVELFFFEELCKILLNFYNTKIYYNDDDRVCNQHIEAINRRRKKIRKTFNGISLENFKDNINKLKLHHGFHMIVKEGVEHLLRSLYSTSNKLKYTDDDGYFLEEVEVNEAQFDVEYCFEEICKILLNFVTL